MMYSEKQYKELLEKNKKLTKENEIKEKENKLLKQQNRQKDEIIHDLDKNNYKGQFETLKLENIELKKKLKIYEEKFEMQRISLGKDSSNSCKPSSTNGFKHVVQNNRVKSGKKPGREKGHKRSAPTVTKLPDEVIKVSKVATCTCGHKTVCPCCNKEYMPKFPEQIKNTINYDEGIKALIVYLNSYCKEKENKNYKKIFTT